MVFFHSLPVPELRECFFSIPFPFPNFGNGIIHSRSRSRTPKCHSRSPLLQTILASLYTHTPLYTFQEGASLSLVVDSLIAPQPHLLPLQFENAHGASHNLQVAHVGGQLPHHSLFHLLPVAAIQLKLPRSHICVESGFLPISKSKAGIWSQVPSIKDGSAIKLSWHWPS